MHDRAHNSLHALVGYGSDIPFGRGKSALIVNHIYKCAGTTLKNILRKEFAANYYVARNNDSWIDIEAAVSKRDDDQAIVIAGHAAWGIHEMLPSDYNAYYVTILRDPVSRLLSEYRMARAQYSPVRTIDDYLSRSQHNCNFMTYWIGNGNLALAKERLESEYFMFGLAEQFDDFVTTLCRQIGIDCTGYELLNKTDDGAVDHDQDAINRYIDNNPLDIELYAWAVKTFRTRLAQDTKSQGSRNVAIRRGLTVTHESAAESSGLVRELIDHGEYDQAIAHVTDADINDEASCINIADLCTQQGRRDDAEYWYSKVKQPNVNSMLKVTTFFNHFRMETSIELLGRTLERYSSITSSIPDSFGNTQRQFVMIELAHCHLALGRTAEAKTLYRSAYEINPMLWEAVRAYAFFTRRDGNTRQAVTLVEPALTAPTDFGLGINHILTDLAFILSDDGMDTLDATRRLESQVRRL